LYFKPTAEKLFYEDYYGYQPNKSAIQVIDTARKRYQRKDLALEFDIKGLFDNIFNNV
jgi:retron-type reverse transcriptase